MRTVIIGSSYQIQRVRASLSAVFLVLSLLASRAAYADLADCAATFDNQITAAVRTDAPAVDPTKIRNDLSANSAIDPEYLTTMSKWTDSWKANLKHRLTNAVFSGGEARVPRDPLSPEFSIEDFQKARQYRSMFETQNRMMSELKDGPKIASARVKLLPDGRQALAAKLLAIRSAKRTIDLTYYIFNSDSAGQALVAELRDAIKRGVSVRFMYDSAGSDSKASAMLQALGQFAETDGGYALDLNGQKSVKRATFEAMEFHPIGFSSFFMLSRRFVRSLQNVVNRSLGLEEVDPLVYSVNRRTHDKILLIDGAFPSDAVVFTGGRNIGDENYDLAPKGKLSNVDMEVMMRSAFPDGESRISTTGSAFEVGTEFQKYFDTLYFHLGNRRIVRGLLSAATKTKIALMDRGHEEVSATLGLNEISENDKNILQNEGFSDSQVQIVGTFHNLYRKGVSRSVELSDRKEIVKNGRALISALEKQMSKETKEITIVSPYLWMSARQIRLMKSWLLRDPARKLTVITNSLMTTDNMLAQILVDGVIGPELMLDRGIINDDGKVIRRSIADQVEIYEFGHNDSSAFGGTAAYGNLHMKAVLLHGNQTAMVGTYNGDPRSTLLNTEGMVIVKDASTTDQLKARLNEIKAKSHLWGSAEYHELRANEKLPLAKKIVAERMSFFYQTLLKLNLWWLI